MARNSAVDFLACQVPMLFVPDRANPRDLEILNYLPESRHDPWGCDD